ncbi:MAG: ComEC/Rec2 family competence protein [Verrucomicrobiota bacterium]
MLRSAPLFPAALIVGAGCGLGLWSGAPAAFWWWVLLVLAVTAGLVLWRWRGARHPIRLALLYTGLWFLAAGWAATCAQWVATDDARRLGPAKRDPGTTWRGVIVSNPVVRASGRVDFRLRVDAWRPLSLENLLDPDPPWEPASGTLYIEIAARSSPHEDPEDAGEAGPFRYGQKIEITGGLDVPGGARNPGGFDWRGYLAQNQIHYTLRARPEAVSILSEAAGRPWMRAAAWAQRWTLERLRLGLEGDPVVAGLIGGMLLGYTHEIPDDLKTAFYHTETYHIFAVSGQNVGVLLVLGLLLLRAAGLTWWRWALLVAPLLIFYVLVTGNQPSAVRALCMALFVMLAWRLERPVNVLNLWAMAVLAVLGYDPRLLGDLGFQLSFAVVLALILLSPPVFRFLFRPWQVDNYIPRVLVPPWRRWREAAAVWVCGLLAGSVAAWVGASLLVVFIFQRVAPIGLLANLWVVPLASLVVVIGTVSVLVSMIAAPLAVAVNQLNWVVVKLMVLGVTWLHTWPGAYFYVPSPEVTWRPPQPELICADAGGSTLGLLRHGERAWILNPGNRYQWNRVMDPMRQFYGINRADGVWITEPSARFGGAVVAVANERLTRRWYLSADPPTASFRRDWEEVREAESPEVLELRAGQDYDLGGGLRVRVLAPLPGIEPTRVADRAAVLLIEYDGRRVLWATRVGFGLELALMEAYPDLRADVLVQGPHGSEDNRTGLWLAHLRPGAIIVPAPPPRRGREARLDLSGFAAGEAPTVWHQRDTGAVTLRWTEAGIVAQPFLPPKRKTPTLPAYSSNE